LLRDYPLLDNSIEVHPIGYNDVVLGLKDVHSCFPAIYNVILFVIFFRAYRLSFRRVFDNFRLFSEKHLFVKYVLKNFDRLLPSVTALSYPEVVELAKHHFPMILWDIDSPNIPYAEYSQYLNNSKCLLLCYSKSGCKF